MITQREAIDQFIAEHKDEISDKTAFNRTLRSIAGKSS